MTQTLKKRILRISPQEVSFEACGFDACDPRVQTKLEAIGHVFVEGYRLALEIPDDEQLAATLERTFDPHHVGFAFEGAGFYYALLDVLMPWRRSRLRAFTGGVARAHDYVVTVGAGFALARVPWGRRRLPHYLQKLDPMLAWCVPDGYGFHQGFFHHRRFVERCEAPPPGWPAYARQLFDAGLGRSLWWVEGADPERLKHAIDRFPESRRAELWCGVGLACAYAGGVEDDVVRALPEYAGLFRADLFSGLPFAARMRQKGENPSPWTERVCNVLLDRTADQAADWIVAEQNAVLAGLPNGGPERGSQRYVAVRRRLTAAMTTETVPAGAES